MVVVSGRQVVRALGKLGYERARQSGSHIVLKGPSGPPIVVPDHKEVAAGTLRSILRSAGITEEKLKELL